MPRPVPEFRQLAAVLVSPHSKLKGKTYRQKALDNLAELLNERDSEGRFTEAAVRATFRVMDYTDGTPQAVSQTMSLYTQVNIELQYDDPPPGVSETCEQLRSTFLPAAPVPTQARPASSPIPAETSSVDSAGGSGKRRSPKSRRSSSSPPEAGKSAGSRRRTS